MRDLSERQSQLFFLINSFLQRYEPPELQPLVDDDVVEAAAALAGTFETAARGVIYEHRPAALPADRLATALKPVLAEAGKRGGSAFERDAAVVLRRIEEAARESRRGRRVQSPRIPRPAGRACSRTDEESQTRDGRGRAPRLIVP